MKKVDKETKRHFRLRHGDSEFFTLLWVSLVVQSQKTEDTTRCCAAAGPSSVPRRWNRWCRKTGSLVRRLDEPNGDVLRCGGRAGLYHNPGLDWINATDQVGTRRHGNSNSASTDHRTLSVANYCTRRGRESRFGRTFREGLKRRKRREFIRGNVRNRASREL